MKCVGHFGSVSAGGTQSNCSLDCECDRGSLLSTRRARLLHPDTGGGRGKRQGERQMAAPKEGRERVEEGQRRRRRGLVRGNVPVDVIRVSDGPLHERAHSTSPSSVAPGFWLHRRDSDSDPCLRCRTGGAEGGRFISSHYLWSTFAQNDQETCSRELDYMRTPASGRRGLRRAPVVSLLHQRYN